MKVCGYCGNVYEDKEEKCPKCGASLLKNAKGAGSVLAEHERIKNEIAQKQKQKKGNKNYLIGAAGIVVAVVIVIACIVGFLNSPQRKIANESKELLAEAEQMVYDGEYADALAILKKIDKEWKDYDQTETVRKKAERGLLLAKLDNYQEEEDYEGLINYIDRNIRNLDADAELQRIYNAAVQKYKENILSEISALKDKEDYVGAIKYIGKLDSSMRDDADIEATYNKVIEDYKAQVISTAEAYVEAGDYTSAKSVLTVAPTYVGNDTDITNKIEEINQQEVINTVLAYETEGNYKDAILYLYENEDIVSVNAELTAKLSECEEKYRTGAIDEAAKVYKSEGYTSAVSVLKEALNVLENDETLKTEKAKYEAAVPVLLTSLACTKQGDLVNVGAKSSKIYKDVTDTAYLSTGVYYLEDWGSSVSDEEKDHAITYFLNQKYDTLTGVIYRPYITLSCEFEWSTDGTVEIYGDDLLLYTGAIAQDEYDAIRLSVDISDVRELKIVLRGMFGVKDGSTYSYYYYYPKLCLADLQVAKAP